MLHPPRRRRELAGPVLLCALLSLAAASGASGAVARGGEAPAGAATARVPGLGVAGPAAPAAPPDVVAPGPLGDDGGRRWAAVLVVLTLGAGGVWLVRRRSKGPS